MQNNQEKILLTKEGLENLKEEHRQLAAVKRPVAVERLSLARAQGDLAENSEYSNAKEELAFIDGKIEELEEVLKRAMVIDQSHTNCQQVRLGCRVTVKASQNTHVFHLVGEWEANPSEAKISHHSPLGHSLMGKKVGDKVRFSAPAGEIIYTVVKID